MDILLLIFLIMPFIMLIVALSGTFSAKSRYNAKFVKYNNEFNEMYIKLTEGHFNNIDDERRITKIKLTVAIVINICFMLVFAYFRGRDILISLCLLVGIILLLVICVKTINNYRKVYKNSYGDFIIKPFIMILNDQLTYKKEDGISEELYRNLKFDDKKFNTYFKDDFVSGLIYGSTYINMSEVRTLNIETSGGDVVKKEIFWGMCGYINLNRKIENEIKIKKDKIKLFTRGSRVNMQYNEFEKHFDIFSRDSSLVNQIITPDVMDILINFFTEYQIEFEIILKDEYMYFRFYTGEMFEGKLFGSEKNVRSLWLYYSIYNFLVYLSKQFNGDVQNTMM